MTQFDVHFPHTKYSHPVEMLFLEGMRLEKFLAMRKLIKTKMCIIAAIEDFMNEVCEWKVNRKKNVLRVAERKFLFCN